MTDFSIAETWISLAAVSAGTVDWEELPAVFQNLTDTVDSVQ